MSALDASRVGSPRFDRHRAFRWLGVAAAVLCGVLAASVLLGAPDKFTDVVFAVVMAPVPFVAWLTYTRAPPELRTLWLLLASAASLWFAGTALWYGLYLAAGGQVPDPPGPSDVIFAAARLTAIAGILVAMRSIVSFRLAALDASVVGALGIAVGGALVDRDLGNDLDTSALVLLNSPLLGTLTLMLIVSGALGSWRGLPLSTALVGAGQALLTLGSMIYSYQSIQHAYVDTRWADMPYTAGAVVSYLAAAAILLRVDRPVRLFRPDIPDHPVGSRVVLLASLGALAGSLGVAVYGQLAGRETAAIVGMAATGWIGAAMAVRARDSIRTAETAYSRLDRALGETERARDRLREANDDLARANAQIQAMHIAFADLLNLADERSSGRMRELIEDAGDDLAELLEEKMQQRRAG
jgi:hypothetical protein